MASSSKNYSRSQEASKKLCFMILDYYKDNPLFPKDFARRIKTQLFTDLNGNICIISAGVLIRNLYEAKFSLPVLT